MKLSPYEEEIKNHYSQNAEWERLYRNAWHRLEYDTTLHFLKKYLPSQGRVLDAGGGPGRYTITLAKLGYDMVLLDLTPKLLEIARHQINKANVNNNVSEIIEGSITDLSMFDDNSFDSVLCLGSPLGHILNEADRLQAVTELYRVVKPQSYLFLSVIGRLAMIESGLKDFPQELEIDGLYQTFWRTGDSHNQGLEPLPQVKEHFTPCHFFLPEEIEDTVNQCGFQIETMVGLEGLASSHSKETQALFGRGTNAWENWWNIHLTVCTHPAVVGISAHFMAICRKDI
jgi:ubiquinone/menaquinone biosynthesis C-methylase UbiE